jgi:hypothetical protein
LQEYHPHTSVTLMLTEVRTVLRHARIAQTLTDRARADPGVHYGPDLGEIRMALAFVVQLLEPWERHGPDGVPDRP